MNLIDFLRRKKQESTTEVVASKKLTEEEISAILDKEIETFFPDNGWWGISCLKRPNDITKAYIPCHTRDNAWLSKLFEQKLADKGTEIPAQKIQQFMEKSEIFDELRHGYELKIVHWQITYMKNGGDGWFLPEGFDEFSLFVSQDVDKMFRGGVVKTLTRIGLPREVIEEGIEKNADLWRNSYMNLGYTNLYEPTILFKGKPPVSDETHRKNWIKLRLYQYYCDNKSSVDKYGVVTPAMQMTEDEVKRLREIVKVQNAKRKAFIAEWDEITPSDVLTPKEIGIDDSQNLGHGY